MSPLSATAISGQAFGARLQRAPLPARKLKVPLPLFAEATPSGTIAEKRLRSPKTSAFEDILILIFSRSNLELEAFLTRSAPRLSSYIRLCPDISFRMNRAGRRREFAKRLPEIQRTLWVNNNRAVRVAAKHRNVAYFDPSFVKSSSWRITLVKCADKESMSGYWRIRNESLDTCH